MSQYGWVRKHGLIVRLRTGDAVLTKRQANELKKRKIITTIKTAKAPHHRR